MMDCFRKLAADIRENGGAWKRLCAEVLNMAVTLAVIAGFFLVGTVLMGDVPLD